MKLIACTVSILTSPYTHVGTAGRKDWLCQVSGFRSSHTVRLQHRWRQHRANNSAIYTEAHVHTHIVVCTPRIHCMPKPTSSWRHWRHLLFQTTSRARWDATHADATQGTSIESQTSNVGTCSSTVYGFLVELSARSTRRHTWNPRANNSCKMRPNPKTRKT